MATISDRELNRIGDGPTATVYAARRGVARVALKVYPKRFDKRTMSAFGKEQARLATVRRVSSILAVDGVDELEGGEPALRMELCAESLASLVERRGPVAPENVLVLGRAMAVALAAAHEAGVVHGGVSPSNVLFRSSGEPVLGDFGVTLRQAVARDPLHAIEYLPPETLRTGTLNESTDLYGLGAVLHFSLSGRCPHPGRLGEQPGARVLRILGEPVPAINAENVPVALTTLVARLLAVDPARRPDDAAQVADQLSAMLGTRPAPDDSFDDFASPYQPHPLPPARPAPHPPAPPAPLPAAPPPPDTLDEFDDFALGYQPPPPARVGPPRNGIIPPPPHAAPVQPPPPNPVAPPQPGTYTFPTPNPFAAPPPMNPRPPAEPGPPPNPAVTPATPAHAAPAPAPTTDIAPAPAPPAHVGEAFPPAVRSTPPPTPATELAGPPAPSPPSPAEPAGSSAPSPSLAAEPAGPPAPSPPPVAELAGPPAPSSSSAAELAGPPASSSSVVEPAGSSVPSSSSVVEPAGPPASSSASAAELAGPLVPSPPSPAEPAGSLVPSPMSGVEPAGGAGPSPSSGAEPPTPLAPRPAAGAGPARPPAPSAPSPTAGAEPVPPLATPATAGAVPADPLAPSPISGAEPANPLASRHVLEAEPATPSASSFSPLAARAPAYDFGTDDFGTDPTTPPPAPPRRVRYELLIGGPLVAVVLAVVLVLLLGSEPEGLPVRSQEPVSGGAPASEVVVELAKPVDRIDHVELTWRSSRVMDFAVVIAAEGEQKPDIRLAGRKNSMTVEVDPDRQYCFQIQASNSDRTYESAPRPLRGATCR